MRIVTGFNKWKLICVTVLMGVFTTSNAQLMTSIGQFQYAELTYNPAYSGSATSIRGQLINRNQYVQIEGAPNSQYLTVDAPIGSKLGLGGVVQTQKIGNIRGNGLSVSLSYRVKLDKESFLQFGLSGGGNHFSGDLNEAFVWDDNDESINNFQSGMIFKIGAGAYYRYKKIHVGLSSPDLVKADPNKVFYDEEAGKSNLGTNLIFNSGVEVYINEFTSFLPNVMLRYYANRPLNYYLNLGIELNQTVIVGFSLVDQSAYGLYTRVSVSPKIKLGFHYEIANGSHELGSVSTNELTLSYGFD